jgi:hypothetical protein
VVGIVLRSLDELERVLLVVREVAILRMLPLRAVSLFADTAYYPPFSFTTSVHSFEVCAAYLRVFPFNTEVHNMFVEVAIKSEGGDGGRKILPPPSLPIEPPTPTPNPQLPPSEPEPSTPAPEPPPIIPSPTPSPSPPPSDGGDGGNGRVVTWHVKVHARSDYREDPESGDIYILLQIFFGVTKTDYVTGNVFHHTEVLEYPGYQVSDLTLTPLGVTYSADSFSKIWRIILPDLEDTFTLSVPPFNGFVPLAANVDEQVHTYSER